MSNINKPQILENLFWRCNMKGDCNIYAEMLKLKSIEKEPCEVQDAIYEYIVNRMGFGKYEVDKSLLTEHGWFEDDNHYTHRHVKLNDLKEMMPNINITRKQLLEWVKHQEGLTLGNIEISVGIKGKTVFVTLARAGERIAYHYKFPL